MKRTKIKAMHLSYAHSSQCSIMQTAYHYWLMHNRVGGRKPQRTYSTLNSHTHNDAIRALRSFSPDVKVHSEHRALRTLFQFWSSGVTWKKKKTCIPKICISARTSERLDCSCGVSWNLIVLTVVPDGCVLELNLWSDSEIQDWQMLETRQTC